MAYEWKNDVKIASHVAALKRHREAIFSTVLSTGYAFVISNS